MLSALRANRALSRALPIKRASNLRTSCRKFSTEAPPPPPKGSSNSLLYTGIGAAAVGGLAWYFYSASDSAKETGTSIKSGIQSVKAAANFVPTQADYQKVRGTQDACG